MGFYNIEEYLEEQISELKQENEKLEFIVKRISNFLNEIKEEKKKSKETYIVTCYFEDEEQKYKYCDDLKEVEEYVLELLHDGEILDNISIFRGNFCEFNFKVEVNDG